MKYSYIEKIYAGWLAKTIGIRLGAPVEGWTYEMIKNVYGEIHDFPSDYTNFAADDDSNGPLFFVRALEDCKDGYNLTSQDVANALLNYAPFEHGFFWWGGYGVSTEHTAYLNLMNGIPAPACGSIKHNGKMVAEQIGGQIFSDCWGLVAPGNPDLAAKYAAEASSVTHDGNGVYGGIFVAACISYAFDETDISKIIEKGLTYIPSDSEYAQVVRSVIVFHRNNPSNWRECYKYIYANFGYDKYPGNCHIIPNSAVMILSLLYGNGDFSATLNICNMCGWDTDCNVGNIATIMGVRGSVEEIDFQKWRKPINDLLICSGVLGSLNITDIPYGASYMAKLAYAIAGEPVPEPFADIFKSRLDSCHFEYPGSTHAIRVRTDGKYHSNLIIETKIENSTEAAATGERSLKVVAKPLAAGDSCYIYKQTYYQPSDFNDSRYDPSFSPLVYPGQTISGCIMIPKYAAFNTTACLYVKDKRTNKIYTSEIIHLTNGVWQKLVYKIPAMVGVLFSEMGFVLNNASEVQGSPAVCFIDDLMVNGVADYAIDFAKENYEIWNHLHVEVSQMTKLKGLIFLEDGLFHLACSDFAEAYTGSFDFSNYKATFVLKPLTGETHMANVRVKGARRSYAAGLLSNSRFAVLKNDNGYEVVVQTDFDWEHGQEYIVEICAENNCITATVNGVHELCFVDIANPYLNGSIGISCRDKSRIACRSIAVKSLDNSNTG